LNLGGDQLNNGTITLIFNGGFSFASLYPNETKNELLIPTSHDINPFQICRSAYLLYNRDISVISIPPIRGLIDLNDRYPTVIGYSDNHRIAPSQRLLGKPTTTVLKSTSMNIKMGFIFLMGTLLYTSLASADKAILAGGCFWCMESDFEKLEGVTDVVSGFTGGKIKNPTYNGNHAGHYEAVEITYDPNKVSYQQLLDYYWVNIDPFDARGQFCDKGHSYLSAIFAGNETEKRLANQSRQKVVNMFPKQKVVTPILDASTFYPIQGSESYHQNYYKTNPVRYKFYRWNCGRDQRLKEIWGDRATH